MRIITRKPLSEFGQLFPDAKPGLDSWYAEVKAAKWSTPNEVKDKYKSASVLKDNRMVFNIGGNKYRLVVYIDYYRKIVYIRFIGKHSEYDKIDAGTI